MVYNVPLFQLLFNFKNYFLNLHLLTKNYQFRRQFKFYKQFWNISIKPLQYILIN
jgi:hypothetical protein